jgi:hypothetical protein
VRVVRVVRAGVVLEDVDAPRPDEADAAPVEAAEVDEEVGDDSPWVGDRDTNVRID